MPPEENLSLDAQPAQAPGPAAQVQYGGDEFVSSSATNTAAKPDLADRLVAWGIARDRQMAQYILIGVIVVCTGIWLYFAFFNGSPAPSAALPAGVPGAPGVPVPY